MPAVSCTIEVTYVGQETKEGQGSQKNGLSYPSPFAAPNAQL